MIYKVHFVFCFSFLVACQPEVNIPDNPNIKNVTWETYHDPDLRYTIQKPLEYQIEEKDNQTVFTLYGVPMVQLSHMTQEKMTEQLLWKPKHKTGRDSVFAELADVYQVKKKSQKAFSPAIGYAFPYKGKIFSLAFRTKNHKLDRVQSMMLRTYRYF